MSEKVLLVDDDPKLLAACERNLRSLFQVDTAAGAEAGLAMMTSKGPYAVVISDRQMPGMDGVQFLAAVRKSAPDTVRVMLTGNADLESTVKVVNEGTIFRFLTKPCAHEDLVRTIQAALEQHRLVNSEKVLLSKTLNGSIRLLTEILGLADPGSFGRSQTLRDVITSMTELLGLKNPWEIHLAVMLSPIGFVTVPPETLMRFRSGQALSEQEKAVISRMPETAARLLSNIPRLEGVAEIIRHQQRHFDGTGVTGNAVRGDAIPVGARLLKILLDMHEAEGGGLTRRQALGKLQNREGWYDPVLLATVQTALGGKEPGSPDTSRIVSVEIGDLKAGMIVYADVVTRDEMLILSAGQTLSGMIIEKIRNFDELSGIKKPILINSYD